MAIAQLFILDIQAIRFRTVYCEKYQIISCKSSIYEYGIVLEILHTLKIFSTINLIISQKFRFYSFLSMFLLVYVHGYNLQNTYLQPWSMVEESLTFTTFFEYLTANALFRFRIPMLFIISGYLYALHDDKPYKERTLKRLRTLGIPYLFWSLAGILLTYFLEYNDLFLAAIKQSGLAMVNDTITTVHQYNAEYWLGRTVIFPLSFQLWFIRVLLFYNIAYPVLKWQVTSRYPAIWLVISGILWFIDFNFVLVEGAGLFFFSWGIWIQKNNFDLEKAPKNLSPTLLLCVFVLICLVKTFLAFQPTAELPIPLPIIIGVLHRTAEVVGMVAIWYGGNKIVAWASAQSFFRFVMSYSFMIYVTHVPILYYVMQIANSYLIEYQYHRLLTYLVIPLAIALSAVLVGSMLKKIAPTPYQWITGGR